MVGALQRCLCISLVVCLAIWGFSLLPQYTLSYEAAAVLVAGISNV